jgi:hypothetical protein
MPSNMPRVRPSKHERPLGQTANTAPKNRGRRRNVRRQPISGSRDTLPTVTEARLAHNEALYRSINEQMESTNQTVEEALKLPSEWICECADIDCSTRIRATVTEYESVRATPRRFMIYPGHATPQIERVVRGNERFTVVEKLNIGAEVADATNPRASA